MVSRAASLVGIRNASHRASIAGREGSAIADVARGKSFDREVISPPAPRLDSALAATKSKKVATKKRVKAAAT